jgi:ABC-2 type transport system permease protein
VRSVWFVVVTVLGPLLMIAMLVIPAWLAASSAEEKAVIQVVDRSGRNLFPVLAATDHLIGPNVDLQVVPPDVGEEVLLRRLREERIDGFLVIPEDVLRGGKAVYRGNNATNFTLRLVLGQALNFAARRQRALDAGFSPETLARVELPPVELIARHDTGRGEVASGEASFLLGFVVMFLLYMSILFYAVNVMRSVVQEKSSRVVEIIISAMKPRALMLGKVIGVGSVGLLQMALWGAVAALLISFRGQLLGLFGVSGDSIELPSLGLVDLLVVVGYFGLGYFLYAALYAAVGAMVNSDQEAQQVQTPIMMLLIVPLLCVQLVANSPRGAATQALTQIPFFSPVLMPMRYLLGGASWLEVGVSLAVLVVCNAAAIALAARIYRVGILMYGKRPSLRELARWLRY